MLATLVVYDLLHRGTRPMLRVPYERPRAAAEQARPAGPVDLSRTSRGGQYLEVTSGGRLRQPVWRGRPV